MFRPRMFRPQIQCHDNFGQLTDVITIRSKGKGTLHPRTGHESRVGSTSIGLRFLQPTR
jgi:hypothetical protein